MSLSLAFYGVGPLAQPYLDTLRKRDDVQLIAVCDLDRRDAEQVAAGWSAKVYPTFDAMLLEAQPDALWICVPARLLSRAISQAVDKRVPFFACPPGGSDFATVQQIACDIEKSRLVTAVGFPARDADVVQEAKEYLGTNVVPLALGWWLSPADETSDTPDALSQLWTDASSSVDAMRVFCGEVTRVRAISPVAGVADPGPKTDLTYKPRGLVLQLEFAGGTVGVLTCATFGRPEPRIELELLGENWSLRYGRDLESLRLDERDKTTILRCLSNPAARQTSAFLEAVTQRNPALVSVPFGDALRTMAVCNAAALSASEKRTVELGNVPAATS